MIHVQSLTVEGCFNIIFLTYKFSLPIENLILRGGPASLICDIRKSLEASTGPMIDIDKCDMERNGRHLVSSSITCELKNIFPFVYIEIIN